MNGHGGLNRLKRAAVALGAVAVIGASVVGAAGGVTAQEATPVAEKSPATVYVNGHGEVITTPDTASVVIGVNIIEPTLAAAQANATAQMEAVIAALKAAGIDEKDIQTVNYSVNIIQNYDERGNPAEIQGFQVSNQVNVVVRDLAKLGEILDTVVAEGANAIYGVNFYVNDPTSAASQARKLAVENARTKAEELAAAAGLTVGRVVSISESSYVGGPPMPYAEAAMDQRAGGAVPIQAGSTTIVVDVQVTFELEGQ